MDKLKFKLKILTPLAITTGNKLLNNVDFFIDKNIIHFINFDKLLSKLSEDKIILLSNYLETDPSQINLNNFISVNDIPQIIKYSVSINNLNINNSNNVKEIIEHIKNYMNKENKVVYGVYIPSSSIKGAIRTSIIYSILKENFQKYKDIIIKDRNYWESKILDTKDKKLLTYLKISDSNIIDASKALYVKNVILFNSSRRINEFIELIKENTEFEISIDIDKLTNEVENKIEKDKKIIIQKLKNFKLALYEFSKDLIQYEKLYFKKKNLMSVISKYEQLEKQNTPESPLIRIGRHTGKLSKTIILLLQNNQLNLPKVDLSLPKTRRLIEENQNNFTPLGWVKLI
ncbi:MAG: type III-A CRISPR-associated RAMP protein Csm5 [bacterium]